MSEGTDDNVQEPTAEEIAASAAAEAALIEGFGDEAGGGDQQLPAATDAGAAGGADGDRAEAAATDAAAAEGATPAAGTDAEEGQEGGQPKAGEDGAGSAPAEGAAAAAGEPSQRRRRGRREKAPPVTEADRLRNVEGRLGVMNDQLLQLNQRLQEAATRSTQASGAAAPSAAEVAAANKTGKLDELKENFPEWGAAIEELQTNLTSRIGDPKKLVDEAVAAATQAAQKVIDEDRFSVVEEKYEGWRDEVKTPEFTAWYTAQPEEIRKLGASRRPIDAIKLLDAYYGPDDDSANAAADPTPPAPDPRQRRIRNAVPATQGGSSRNRSVQSVEQAFEDGFAGKRG